MKKSQRKILSGLIISMSVGFLLGIVAWIIYGQPAAMLWFPISGALFYHHLQWLRKINKGGGNIKIKSFTWPLQAGTKSRL